MKTPTVSFKCSFCRERLIRLFDAMKSQLPTAPLSKEAAQPLSKAVLCCADNRCV
jgi:hypothetical protein